jgi:lysophospholipase L1-like esterase
MKHFLALALVLVTGCSTMQSNQPSAHFAGPDRSVVHMPRVTILGDTLVTAWGTEAIKQQEPLWTFAGSPAGTYEYADQILARLPAALATHPDVLVILAGTIDMGDPLWLGPCGPDTCTNVVSMILLAQQAGVRVLVCTLPTTQDGPEGTLWLEMNPYIPDDEADFNQAIAEFRNTEGWNENGVIDLAKAVAGTQWTTDGLSPNDSGAQSFTSAAEAQIAALRVGGSK